MHSIISTILVFFLAVTTTFSLIIQSEQCPECNGDCNLLKQNILNITSNPSNTELKTWTATGLRVTYDEGAKTKYQPVWTVTNKLDQDVVLTITLANQVNFSRSVLQSTSCSFEDSRVNSKKDILTVQAKAGQLVK